MRILFLIIFVLVSIRIQAQLFDIDHLIDTDVGFISTVGSGDFDNDNDQDLLVVSSQMVVWYENLDGLGTFGDPNIIDSGMGQALNQTVTDLDGDNKEDILISYFDQDFIAYYRNQGGGNFAPFEVIVSGLQFVRGISPANLDGDNDIDLVLGVTNGVGFYWIEHLDGNGTFGPLITIDNTLSQARTQAIGDIDGDNDLDILTNSSGGTILSWFENTDGQGTFSQQHIIETSGQYENFIGLADLDGDDDLDNISLKINQALWRENLDGLGNFGPANTLFIYSDPTPDFGNIHAVDLDNDDDLDITFDSGRDFGKVYHINLDGQGDFGVANFVEPQAGGSTGNNHPVDIDGDGDMDLINTSLFSADDRVDIYWYENLTILGNEEYKENLFTLFPNPVKNVLTIESDKPIVKMTCFDILGQKLFTIVEGFDKVDFSHLSSGLLFIEIETESTISVEKVIKK